MSRNLLRSDSVQFRFNRSTARQSFFRKLSMPVPLVVIDVVGLTYSMLGPNTPHLQWLAREGFARPMGTVLPAVTCTAQSTILTGLTPGGHGAVANGWYFRDLSEVWFW